jgi:ABC-type transport system involved in cytochrome c biogenesis permease subunit
MKRLLPLLVILGVVIYLGASLRPPKNETAFDVVGFGHLPLLANGRIKPFDTVARSSLLQLQNRQRVSSPDISEPLVATPTEWLLDVFFRSEKADTYPTFAIDNPELLTLIGKSERDLKINYTSTAKKVLSIVGFLPSHHRRFSFNEIWPNIKGIEEQARMAQGVESAVRSPFQRAVLQLYGNIYHYFRLKHALVAPGRNDFLQELLKFQEKLPETIAAFRAKEAKQPHDEAAVKTLIDLADQFGAMDKLSNFLVVPPEPGNTDPTAWKTAGAALLETFRSGHVNPNALAYAGLAQSWREQNADRFNTIIKLYRADLDKRFEPELKKCAAETRFNAAAPFSTSMNLYGLAFGLALASWMVWPRTLARAAFWIVMFAWIATTIGIATRMWLEDRPPVTNLYSSALFIGWGAVALSLVLEAIYKNAIGSVTAGVVGFATLIIAHHLSLSGDTLEMMRAVLDSNFWLATHVVVVTLGYASTFLAGFLALLYVVRGLLTKTLDKATADSLARMVYGIVCFATLFSFVGTILGGIWADQSWGRFWGWDPKENGALLIVIWNAIILHARWGGMIKQRGLMCLAIGGNIVTSWSWFGTNMLGVGLHSYGFTDAAFVALATFVVSQLFMIGLANVPLSKWRSFRSKADLPAPLPHEPEIVSANSR